MHAPDRGQALFLQSKARLLSILQTKDDTRHLLRIWVASEDERPLPDVFKWQWGTTEVGHRGGWQMPLGKGLAPHVPLEPCPPTHT